MSKHLWFLIVSTFFLFSASAATVEVSINFEEDKALFSYVFNFEEGEKYTSFSFERPSDAILLSALDQESNFIKTSVAGDYFIVYPEFESNPNENSNNTVTIEFESKSSYNNIVNNNIFSSYFTFNFDIEELLIQFDYAFLNKDLLSVNPRDYIVNNKDSLEFLIRNLDGETFLQVEFTSNAEGDSNNSLSYFEEYFYIVLSLLLLIIVFAAFFLRGYIKNLKGGNKRSSNIILGSSNEEVSESIDVTVTSGDKNLVSSEANQNSSINPDVVENEQDKEKELEEYMDKYLTENEKEVVLVVKQYSGIPQNEILHHLPSLTKSNLSKIITKLHGKQVLSRIRVGKINKIYLGDKLNFNESTTEENK